MNLPEYFAMILDKREAKYKIDAWVDRPEIQYHFLHQSGGNYEGYIVIEALQRLKEIEALREVLKIHNTYDAIHNGESHILGCVGCGSAEYSGLPRTWDINECPTLLTLVKPYSDRADFGTWN